MLLAIDPRHTQREVVNIELLRDRTLVDDSEKWIDAGHGNVCRQRHFHSPVNGETDGAAVDSTNPDPMPVRVRGDEGSCPRLHCPGARHPKPRGIGIEFFDIDAVVRRSAVASAPRPKRRAVSVSLLPRRSTQVVSNNSVGRMIAASGGVETHVGVGSGRRACAARADAGVPRRVYGSRSRAIAADPAQLPNSHRTWSRTTRNRP
jgi:hypothetical protein